MLSRMSCSRTQLVLSVIVCLLRPLHDLLGRSSVQIDMGFICLSATEKNVQAFLQVLSIISEKYLPCTLQFLVISYSMTLELNLFTRLSTGPKGELVLV